MNAEHYGRAGANVLARVIWPATFARSAGPPGGQNGRTYNINKYIYIDGGAPVVRLGGLAPARPIKYGNYHGRLIGKALNGLHSNVLLGQITISNTRSKRVNEIITTCCTHSQ